MLISNTFVADGSCYQLGQSIKYPASLSGASGAWLALEIHTPDGLKRMQADLNSIEVSDAVGNIPRSLTFSEGWVFIAKEPAALNAYLNMYLKRNWADRLESSCRWIVAAIVGTILFVLGGYYYGVPALTNSITSHLPNVAYEQTGQQTLRLLDEAYFKPSTLSVKRQQQLLERFNKMVRNTNIGGPAVPKLIFREMGAPNAMALADGTVVVTDELVGLLKTDEQIDAVIYHELGHVHHAHVMHSLVRSSLVSLGLVLIIGDSSGIADIVSGGASFILMMNYSREMEKQADEFAAKQLKSYGGTVRPLIEAFQLLQNKEKKNSPQNNKQESSSSKGESLTGWLSSHPDTDTRISHILSFE